MKWHEKTTAFWNVARPGLRFLELAAASALQFSGVAASPSERDKWDEATKESHMNPKIDLVRLYQTMSYYKNCHIGGFTWMGAFGKVNMHEKVH